MRAHLKRVSEESARKLQMWKGARTLVWAIGWPTVQALSVVVHTGVAVDRLGRKEGLRPSQSVRSGAP